MFFGILLPQVVFALRTWAIWRRRRCITIGLLALALAAIATELYFTTANIDRETASSPAGRVDVPAQEHLPHHPSQPVAIWIIVSVVDLCLMVLSLIQCVQHAKYRSSSATVATIIYRDGILFIVAAFAISMAYLLVTFLPTGSSIFMISRCARSFVSLADKLNTLNPPRLSLQYCLYTILACRVILHLRAIVVGTQAEETIDCSTFIAVARSTQSTSLAVAIAEVGASQARGTVAWFGHGLLEEGEESSVLVIGRD
ncbi:hypothetical protein EXIGLDRAFT_458869 [Exidia glandulosa HHB12029]|uniref:Uncharacterized protein n=1 Tax=Exidia glandulosa HHB12029 TaxID=1314781 RepID=A0A165PQ04_EXIGL|nr:hypothetical protein EXIGLDRAFT_458869 [Exidia glandulosa HHB12029]